MAKPKAEKEKPAAKVEKESTSSVGGGAGKKTAGSAVKGKGKCDDITLHLGLGR